MLKAMVKALKDNNIKFKIEKSDCSMLTDDSIELANEYYIQVGRDYLILGRWIAAEEAAEHILFSKNPLEITQEYLVKNNLLNA